MLTGIDHLWAVMDRDIAAGKASSAGWLLRLARPSAGCPLFVAIELASRRRAVFLRLPVESVPSRRRWPRCKGLESVSLRIGGSEHFGVALKEERFKDVFSALAEDLVRRVSEASTPSDQVRIFLGQLARWQKFLTTSTDGLTDEEQRGLWGELHFLRDGLLPVVGWEGIGGWKGAERAHQDFQFAKGAIEVKTTIAKQPQVVRIASERQLDDTFWPTLILHVIAVDVRDGSGETLPELIASLRSTLDADSATKEQFEDTLLLANYLDVHAARYLDRGYVARSETTFHVTSGFPMLAERNMPTGIGDINYGLSVAACKPFSISPTAFRKRMIEMTDAVKHKKGKKNA